MTETLDTLQETLRAQLDKEPVPRLKERIQELNAREVEAGQKATVIAGPKARLVDGLVAAYVRDGVEPEPLEPPVQAAPKEEPATAAPPPEPEPDEPEQPATPPERTEEPGTALVPLAPPETVMPTVKEYAAMRAIANEICRTEFVPQSLRNRPEAVLAAIMYGRELGIGPMQALKDISIIDGKAALSASLMMALMRKGGVQVLESESTKDRAMIKAKRADTGEVMTAEWTYEDAKTITYKAKGGVTKLLVEKDNWTNYPADMLWARCVGRIGRRLAPDILGGMGYSAEEMQDFDGDWSDDPYSQPQNATVEQWAPPAGWGELRQRFAAALGNVNEVSLDEATEWMKQALQAKVEVDSIAALTPEQTKAVWRPLCDVVRKLETFEGDVAFHTNLRDLVSGYFKETLKVNVVGPPWRLGPSEETLPTYYEVTGKEPPAAPASESQARDAVNDPDDNPPEDADWEPITHTPEEMVVRNAAWAQYKAANVGQELPDEAPDDWEVGQEYIPF